MTPDFHRDRPRNGYCYLDFVEHWLRDAMIFDRDPDRAYKYAREYAHIAMQFQPNLRPDLVDIIREGI